MRSRFMFAPLAALSLASCATLDTSGVRLNVDKAFVTSQVTFKSLQQAALAGIQSGAIKGPVKNKIIDVVDVGQKAENLGVAARGTLNLADEASAVAGLTDAVGQLTALGVKGN